MQKRQVVAAGCVFLMLGLIAGICVILWRKTSDDDNNAPKQAPITHLNLSQFASLDIHPDRIDLNLRRMSEDNAAFTPTAILAKGIDNETKMTIEDSWESDGNLYFEWENMSSLHLRKLEIKYRELNCMNVEWNAPNGSIETPIDCFDMNHSFWFGGFEDAFQIWPINNGSIPSAPFTTGDGYQQSNIGDLIEGLFISSAGVGIYIHDNSTTYLSVNENNSGQLCLYGKIGQETPYFNTKEQPTQSYDICQSPNILQLWKNMAANYLPAPTGIPSEDVLRYPIWSTWAQYKAGINQTQVMEYATEIKRGSYGISQLELDDNWTPKYGDFEFDNVKFPQIKEMINSLTKMNIPLTVWMHPFFNNDSMAFDQLSEAGLLLKEPDSNEPALTQWWRGDNAGILDLTNPTAVEWYLNKTRRLQKEYNVTSFKFDAGEVNLLPESYTSQNPVNQPNEFSKLYAQMAHKADMAYRRQEVRTGFKTQNLPILVRMIDRASSWGHERGLKTLIPCALTMGLMGYPFVLPDMIGGNAYNNGSIDETAKPNPELFVRWLQVTTLMPSIQFSIPPWSYNDTVVAISKKFITLHESFANKLIALAESAMKKGEPILRPIWWIAPEDTEALKIESQFLLGDDVLVAPVLDEGVVNRDIYLPKGQWRYDSTGQYKKYSGPKWLRNFPAPFDVLPYFTRVHFN